MPLKNAFEFFILTLPRKRKIEEFLSEKLVTRKTFLRKQRNRNDVVPDQNKNIFMEILNSKIWNRKQVNPTLVEV